MYIAIHAYVRIYVRTYMYNYVKIFVLATNLTTNFNAGKHEVILYTKLFTSQPYHRIIIFYSTYVRSYVRILVIIIPWPQSKYIHIDLWNVKHYLETDIVFTWCSLAVIDDAFCYLGHHTHIIILMARAIN